MREYTDFSKDWLVKAEDSSINTKYAETKTGLPFIHKASDFTEISFEKKYTVPEKLEGKTVYLEFRQVSGLAQIFINDSLTITHDTVSTRFRVMLTDNAYSGETFDIKAVVFPSARSDGNFIFGSVSVLSVERSHFDLDDDGTNGIYIDINYDKADAELTIRSVVINPTNYDVLSFSVVNSTGETVCTKTVKPTDTLTSLSVPSPMNWGGQKDADMYILKALLIRDTVILDNLEVPFGIKDLAIEDDKFLRLNGIKLPLNGIEFANCSYIKTDKVLFDLLDANSLITDMIPSKTDLLTVCDKAGTVFWYELPFTGKDKDMDELREFLKQNYNHPSLAFVCCSSLADEAYFRRFKKICRDYGPSVFTAMKFDIKSAAYLPKELPDVIAITIHGKDKDDNFLEIKNRLDDIKRTNADTSFALFAYAPVLSDKNTAAEDGFSENELCLWHERLWNTFCREKTIIGFFAGALSDAPERPGTSGLVSADRQYIKDAFWFYKSQFSAHEFVKICAADIINSEQKKIDIKCYTNTSPLRILVNGDTKKKYKAEEIYDGVFVFRKVTLKNRTNIIEVSSGDQFDRAEINYGK